ncbi:hypothetical protein O9992_01545 [Vibrio lentus]|nr:hypothetical protein [Vibrio lentus]
MCSEAFLTEIAISAGSIVGWRYKLVQALQAGAISTALLTIILLLMCELTMGMRTENANSLS